MTAALDQLCSSRTRICVLKVSQAFIGNDFERTAVTEKARRHARERLPTLHRDINVAWLQFHPQTDSAGRLGSYQRRAAAEKWVIHCLAGIAVILYRPSHAFDGLLGAVGGFGVLATAGNAPKRGLFAVAGPMTFGPYSVPARFMLPVIISSAHHKPFLGPNDLRTDGEAIVYKTSRDSRGV
jgi:hypothetical protein